MQYIIQIYAENHTGAQCESLNNLLRDEESDALHKIIFIKIQNANTLDVKICPRSRLLFVLGRLWRKSQYISAMSETQGGGLIREKFPSNATPAQARELGL